MKTALALLLCTSALVSCTTSGGDSKAPGAMYVVDPGDRAAVLAALEDYVDGFTMGQPKLLERCLVPNLVKKGYRRASADEPYGDALPLSYDDALALAARRGAADPTGEAIHSTVSIFEVADKTAAGKVVAPWGIDYVHLVKDDGRWMIHHVIWQTEPPLAAK